ncbi:putative transcriptional regulator [Mycobacteroides salmoniphilum]|uniref:Transcriptional regulator n=1 Tax=Mycobacteroides salmoniphilum TaxID=404941 RepID=A0A4V3HZ99_9MYCO|nr:putative transcriptional regulator [Mycobacteroides salmoniphilum]TEA07688.1 putative transcriptional regulator [Mycobacteroides salmoniphilum]
MQVTVTGARERLLEAAAQLTYLNGIDVTGVDAIAKEAGVTKRTLYQHFRSKEELVAAALQARDEPTIAGLRAAIDHHISRGLRPVEALFAVLTLTFAIPGFRGCAFLNAGLEMHADDHLVRPVTRSHTDARRNLIADLVRAEGIDDEWVTDAVTLLVEGTLAAGAARRDTDLVGRAAQSAEHILTLARATPLAT